MKELNEVERLQDISLNDTDTTVKPDRTLALVTSKPSMEWLNFTPLWRHSSMASTSLTYDETKNKKGLPLDKNTKKIVRFNYIYIYIYMIWKQKHQTGLTLFDDGHLKKIENFCTKLKADVGRFLPVYATMYEEKSQKRQEQHIRR